MPRRRRRQTLPALVVGTVLEAVHKARADRATSQSRPRSERGEIAAPVPRPQPRPAKRAARKTRPATPRTKADRANRVRQVGQTQSRIVVAFLVLALGVPFFTMNGVRTAVAAGTISYGGHIGTGGELYGPCPGNPDQTLTPDADAEVREEDPSGNHGTISTMDVQSSTAASKHRSLVRFPLPSIPAGCFLSSARLEVDVVSNSNNRTIQAVPASSAWSENSVTWSSQPTSAGPVVSTNSHPSRLAWPVTAQVQYMYDNANNGFILRDANETSGNTRQNLRSRESGSQPRLILSWGSGLGSSVTITTTSNVPAGNSVVVSVAMDDANGAVSASDSAGNVYTVDADAAVNGQVRGVVLSAHNMARLPAGSTITVSHPLTGSRAVSANQFAGLADTGTVVDTSAGAGTSTAPSSGAVTTSSPDALLVSAFGIGGGATYSATGGFTPMPGYIAPGVGQLATQYRIVSSAGSYTSTASLSSTATWAGGVAAYRMDTVLPTPAISTPTVGSLAPATPTFEGTAGSLNSDAEIIKLKIYAGGTATGTPVEVVDVTRAGDGSWTHDQITPLGDGVYTIQVEQTDGAGNVGLSAPVSFTVDTLAPDAPLVTSPSPDPGNENNVAWTFLGEAGGSFECRLTKDAQVISPYTTCTSPDGYLLTDGDGIYSFSVRQTDDAGNVGPETNDDYVLDTQNPAAPVVTGPDPDPSYNDQAVWNFTFEPGADVECRLMKGALMVSPWAPCTSPATHTLVDGDGTYTFSARQTDRAGNGSPIQSDDYTLDTVVPTTTIDAGPNGLTNSSTVSFEFSSDDPTATFECSLDGGGFTPCATPLDYNNLGDGAHQFEVRAVDEAGNIDPSPDVRTFSLDTGAPPLSIDNAPTDPDNNTNVTWQFSSETGAAIECELAHDGNVVVPFGDCSSGSATYNLGPDGLYTFNVRASDAAGNTSVASDTYVLDTGDPVSAASSTPLTASPSIVVGYSQGDAGAGVAEVELWVNAPGGGGFALADVDTSLSGSFTYTAVDGSGTYEFYTRAVDAAGNREAAPGGADTATVLDMDAPAVTIDSAPSDPTSDPTLNFTFSSVDPTASFACSLSSDGTDNFSPCSSPVSYTSPTVTTPYTFKVIATDAAGNVGPAATWNFMYEEPVVVTPTPTETTPEPTPTETTPEPTPTETTPSPTPTVTETESPSPTPSITETQTPEPPPTQTPDPPKTPQPTQPPIEPPPTGGGGTTTRVEEPEPAQPKPPKPTPTPDPRPKPRPPLDDGDDLEGVPVADPSDPISRLQELAKFAAEAVKTFAFPLLLAILVIAFLLVQHWIDKKDPKLAMAPVHSNHDLTKFG